MDSHDILISYFVLVIGAFAFIWLSAWLELDEDEDPDNDLEDES